MKRPQLPATVFVGLVCGLLSSCSSCDPPTVSEGEGDATNEGEGEEGEGEEGEGEGEDDNACFVAADSADFAVSAKADLRWKRATALRNDLIVALGLTEPTVCSELGLDGTCFSLIHLVPLGGNNPVDSAMYKPIASPGATTALSIDRVVLSACGIRADAEALDLTPRILWPNIDFTQTALAADDAGVVTDVTALYRRLLARNPTPAELELVTSLTEEVNGEPVNPRDFAKLACFAIATTTEFLFH